MKAALLYGFAVASSLLVLTGVLSLALFFLLVWLCSLTAIKPADAAAVELGVSVTMLCFGTVVSLVCGVTSWAARLGMQTFF